MFTSKHLLLNWNAHTHRRSRRGAVLPALEQPRSSSPSPSPAQLGPSGFQVSLGADAGCCHGDHWQQGDICLFNKNSRKRSTFLLQGSSVHGTAAGEPCTFGGIRMDLQTCVWRSGRSPPASMCSSKHHHPAVMEHMSIRQTNAGGTRG